MSDQVEISPRLSLVVDPADRAFCERCGARLINGVCTNCPPGLEGARPVPPGPPAASDVPPTRAAESSAEAGVVVQEEPLVIVAPPPPRRRHDIEVPDRIVWAADAVIDNGPGRSR
jgi:hypothetical protein